MAVQFALQVKTDLEGLFGPAFDIFEYKPLAVVNKYAKHIKKNNLPREYSLDSIESSVLFVQKNLQYLKTIKLACSFCHRTMAHNKKPLSSWDKSQPGYSHGICLDCLKGIEEIGWDAWADHTEPLREPKEEKVAA